MRACVPFSDDDKPQSAVLDIPRKLVTLLRIDMCTDICSDRCTGMCTNICPDMRTDMCLDVR